MSCLRFLESSASLALVSHLLTGCGSPDAPLQTRQIDAGRLPEKVPIEVYRLGGMDVPEEEVFSRVPRLAVGPDGSLVALAVSANEARRFGPDGTFLNVIGGPGEGPGEFTFAYDAGFVGDTLWIRNLVPAFVSFFTLDGEYLRTERPTRQVIARGGVPRGPAAMLRGGATLVVDVVPLGGRRGRGEVPLMIVDAGDREADTIATLIDPPSLYLPGVGSVAGRPYPPPPYFKALPFGGGAVVAEWGGTGTSPGAVELRRYGADGSLQARDTVLFSPLSLDREAEDSLIGAVADTVRAALAKVRAMGVPNPPEAPADLPELIREQLGLGVGFLPPIRALLAGTDGTIWLERLTGPSTGEWVCFDSGARALFRVTLPSGELLQAASRGQVWTTWTDSLDVPYILGHDLADPR